MVLSHLFHIGAIEVGDEDLFPFSLKSRICNFCIMDSSLSCELKDDLIGHPMNHVSEILKLAFILFPDEVFLFH